MKPEFQKELERRLRQVEAPPPPAGLSRMLKSEIPAEMSLERKRTPVRLWSIWGLSWQYGSAVVMIVALSYVTLRLMQGTGLPESAELRSTIPVTAVRSPIKQNEIELQKTQPADHRAAVLPQQQSNSSSSMADKAISADSRKLEPATGKILSEQTSQIAAATRSKDTPTFAPEPASPAAPPPAIAADAGQVADARAVGSLGGAAAGATADDISIRAAAAPVEAAKPVAKARVAPQYAREEPARERQTEDKLEALRDADVTVTLFESPLRKGEVVARVVAPAGVEIKTLQRSNSRRFSDEKTGALSAELKKKEDNESNEGSHFITFRSSEEFSLELKRSDSNSPAATRSLDQEKVTSWAAAPLAVREEFLASELNRLLAAGELDRKALRKLSQVVDELSAATNDAKTRELKAKIHSISESEKH